MKGKEPKQAPRLVTSDWLSWKLCALREKAAELRRTEPDNREALDGIDRTLQAVEAAYLRSLMFPEDVIELLPLSEDEFILDGEHISVTGLFYWLETGRLVVGGHSPQQMCIWLRGWARAASPAAMRPEIEHARKCLHSLKLNFGFSPA